MSQIAQTDPTYGDYRITFDKGDVRRLSGVLLSRKLDSMGNPWISVRGGGGDWLYNAGTVTSIVKLRTNNTPDVPLEPMQLPLRTLAIASHERSQTKTNGPTTQIFVNLPTCSVEDTYCRCNLFIGCVPVDENAVCADEGSVTSGCGVDESGNGQGLLREWGVGIQCDVDLSANTSDCFLNAVEPPNRSGVPDLFKEYRTGFTHATLTCFNPVNPGWNNALYADKVQGGISRIKLVSGGPGQNSIDFPDDFILGDAARPITNPSGMTATFWKFGFTYPISKLKQGKCKGSIPKV